MIYTVTSAWELPASPQPLAEDGLPCGGGTRLLEVGGNRGDGRGSGDHELAGGKERLNASNSLGSQTTQQNKRQDTAADRVLTTTGVCLVRTDEVSGGVSPKRPAQWDLCRVEEAYRGVINIDGGRG
jgi:hypothetical protein